MLINCDCKTIRDGRKHTFAHTAWKPRSLNTPYFTGVEYQYDQPNDVKFKIIQEIHLSITQVYRFTQLCHFRLVSPTFLWIQVAETQTGEKPCGWLLNADRVRG
jgi:hypothetical protein